MSPIVLRIGGLAFSWSSTKYRRNVAKHGITFEEAATTWLDQFAIEHFDELHASGEDRWLRIGWSLRGALLVVWSTERETDRQTVIRIIGARRASRKELRLYEAEKQEAGRRGDA